jgi:restriction system protein
VAERLSNLTPTPPVLSQTPAPAIDAREPPRELNRDLLMALEWKRFELLVARTFSATGIRAELTCTGADGGVDIYLYHYDEGRPYSYVQCKAWSASKLVTVDDMRAFFGAMASDKVAEGVYVTTSDFTPPAREFASLNGITALSGTQFLARYQELPDGDRRRILTEVTAGDYTTPTCPSCDVKLIWRENGQFWGCRRFPRCSVKIYRRN